MGIGCLLFLWSLLAVAASIVAAIGVFVLVWGVLRRRRVRAVIGGVLAAGGAVVAVAAVMFVASWVIFGNMSYDSTSPAVFRDEFGFAAPPDVTSFRSSASGSTDFTKRFFRFRTSPQTIRAIVNGRFRAAPFGECETQFRQLSDRRPKWWQPPHAATSSCYKADPFDDAFASNTAWLAYDPRSGDAHYYYLGID